MTGNTQIVGGGMKQTPHPQEARSRNIYLSTHSTFSDKRLNFSTVFSKKEVYV